MLPGQNTQLTAGVCDGQSKYDIYVVDNNLTAQCLWSLPPVRSSKGKGKHDRWSCSIVVLNLYVLLYDRNL